MRPRAAKRLNQGHIDGSSWHNKRGSINIITSSLSQILRVWIRQKIFQCEVGVLVTLSTDLSKRSPLIVVTTVVGDTAQAPSSGQHELQHSLDKRLRLLHLHHTSLSECPREATQRSPGLSFTRLCITIQQFTCGSLFSWIVISVISCLRKNVRIRYVWVAAL